MYHTLTQGYTKNNIPTQHEYGPVLGGYLIWLIVAGFGFKNMFQSWRTIGKLRRTNEFQERTSGLVTGYLFFLKTLESLGT
jgi:hypothetical protein